MPVVILRWERGSPSKPSPLSHARMHAGNRKRSRGDIWTATLRECVNDKTANALKRGNVCLFRRL